MKDNVTAKTWVSAKAELDFNHLYGSDAPNVLGQKAMFQIAAWTAFQLIYGTSVEHTGTKPREMLAGFAAGWLSFAQWMHIANDWASSEPGILNTPAYSVRADDTAADSYAIVREDNDMNEEVIARSDSLKQAQNIALALNRGEVLVPEIQHAPELDFFCAGGRRSGDWPIGSSGQVAANCRDAFGLTKPG